MKWQIIDFKAINFSGFLINFQIKFFISIQLLTLKLQRAIGKKKCYFSSFLNKE